MEMTGDTGGATADGARGPVALRQVFYIPGYDPFPPRRYRELYRREAAAQAAISGHRIKVQPSPDATAWRVRAQIEEQRVRSDFEVLVWSDIVRSSMDRGVAQTYLQMLHTGWIFGVSGAFWRLIRLRKGPAIAGLYPVAVLLGQLGLALVAARLAGGALAAGLAAIPGLPAMLATGTAWAGALAVLIAALRWFRAQDRRLFAHYLMHDYAFTAAHRGAYAPELEARLAAFTLRITEALDDDRLDEVLVVGHSSGAHLAISVLADLIRAGRVRTDGPTLGLLTLGQVVPMVAFLPAAHRLRSDLRLLSRQEALAWIDVSAPGDGCSFALCDPVAVSGAAGPGKRWPLVISAAFTQTLDPARLRALRWRFFRLHFQYLCAFDRPGGYDYFAITAGPRTLSDRFAGRAPSKSRIERVASGHTAAA